MNKWSIAGNDSFYRIVQTDLTTKQANGFDAEHPMKLNEALAFVMGEACLGDMIVLPNGIPLSVSRMTASA
jgi:hypothetical protein